MISEGNFAWGRLVRPPRPSFCACPRSSVAVALASTSFESEFHFTRLINDVFFLILDEATMRRKIREMEVSSSSSFLELDDFVCWPLLNKTTLFVIESISSRTNVNPRFLHKGYGCSSKEDDPREEPLLRQ